MVYTPFPSTRSFRDLDIKCRTLDTRGNFGAIFRLNMRRLLPLAQQIKKHIIEANRRRSARMFCEHLSWILHVHVAVPVSLYITRCGLRPQDAG